MIRHLARVAFTAVALTCWFAASETQAAMGLKCSNWLNARAHMRFDESTGRFVAANPAGAPPVSPEVDNSAALLSFYVAGTVETLTWLDGWLSKMADAPGVKLPPKVTAVSVMEAVEGLCRRGLEKQHLDDDALDIVSQNNQALVFLRAHVIQELLEKHAEAGRREGVRR